MRRAVVPVLVLALVGVAVPASAAVDRPVTYLERDPATGRWFPMYQDSGGKVRLAAIDSLTAPSISPDGNRVVFAGVFGDGSLGRNAVYLVNIDGSGLTRLTTASYSELDPAWAPDGNHIVYSRNSSGSLSRSVCCRLVRLNLSSRTEKTLTASIGALRPDYSPDSTLLAFDNPTGVWTMPSGGGGPTLRAFGGWDPTFSPDGERLAYVARSGSSHVIRSVSVGGGGAATLYSTTRVIESPVWAGDRIYFVEHLGFGYDGRTSITHRSIPASGGSTTTHSSFGGVVAELGMSKTDPSTHLVTDVTDDGRSDVVALSGTDRTVLRSTGSEFDAEDWGDLSPATGWARHVVGDFNGDDSGDTAGYRSSDGTWRVSLADGSDFSTSLWANYSTATGWSSQIVGDFNGDGRDDIANFHPSNGTWWVSHSTGSGFTTSLWANYTTASGWTSQIVGDFNGDGRDDIANFHPSNGTWWVSASTGSGFTTSLWANYSTASGWSTHEVGDFDDDGRDDIANFHPSNGTWWVSRSTGSSFSTSLWANYSTAGGWSSQVAGDFNGDGRDDIANHHGAGNTWWVSLSQGSSFSTSRWEP